MPAPSQSAIAEALGISPRRVRQLIAEEGMPVHSIEAAKKWKDAKLAASPQSDDELRFEKIRLTKAQASKAEFALEVERNFYLKRAEVLENMTKISTSLAAFIARAIADLPGIVEGLPRSKSAPIIKARLRELQTKFADSNSEFWKEHPEKKVAAKK